ncbi:MAG: MarC family protein [Anaerolineae bacterium]|nr:MarC family protein [Anaerolineae bacterium]
MTITLQELFLLFVSLFTLYSPLSNVGAYASLVGHFPRVDQKKLAFRIFINVLIVMLLFVWVGEFLFDILGVNSFSLSIAGGIALMVAGLPMMLGKREPEEVEESEEPQNWREIVVIPMTFPLSMGGTTAAYIVTASSFARNALDLLAISVVVVLFGVVIWLTHLLSPPLAARLSPQSRRVLSRIGGIILVAIAIQLFAGGLKGLFPVLEGQ